MMMMTLVMVFKLIAVMIKNAISVNFLIKDFERFCGENGPPEDLDEMDNLVTKLLDLEDQ